MSILSLYLLRRHAGRPIPNLEILSLAQEYVKNNDVQTLPPGVYAPYDSNLGREIAGHYEDIPVYDEGARESYEAFKSEIDA